MEDAPLTAQVVMPSVREDEGESANSHSRNHSQASSYVILNDDPQVQMPLLERNESNESTNERETSNAHTPSRSVDISDIRYSDQSSPLPTNPESADPRGEAPPYFEVVGDLPDIRRVSGDLARVTTADTLPVAPDTSPEASPAIPPVRRRSMLRGLIDAASRALSSPHPPTQPPPIPRPSRDVAVPRSPRPSNLSNRPAGARSPLVGHRTTASNSGSVFSESSSAFGRVLSRSHSRSMTNVAAGLNSPSAISITSISAPLTHTAIRTDFVYPRSGPTPEQLKLISSVESVSKFGVPYGPDAVAYTSQSLVNLHGPPPEFEERPSVDSLPGPSVAATRARATSALSRLSHDGNAPQSRLSQSSLPSAPRQSIVSIAAVDEPGAAASHPGYEARLPDEGASMSELTASEDKEPAADNRIATILIRAPSPSPTVETTSTAVAATKTTAPELSAASESLDHTGPSSNNSKPVPALLPFGAETTAGAATATARNPIAPSSFRMPSTPLGRTHSPSRSSSIDTFCTAASKPEEGREPEPGTSDTEHEGDAFVDAQSGAETEGETPPVTPHAIAVESTLVGFKPPTLSV
jgi:hypothetical protein